MTTLHSFIELKIKILLECRISPCRASNIKFNVDQLKDLLVDRFLLNLKYKGELLCLQK